MAGEADSEGVGECSLGFAAPPLEGAELSAAVTAFAAHGAWDRVASALDEAEEARRSLCAPPLQKAIESAAEAREWGLLLRLFRGGSGGMVAALPQPVDGATPGGGDAGRAGGTAGHVGPHQAGREEWAEEAEWAGAAEAGFAVDLNAAPVAAGAAGVGGGAKAAGVAVTSAAAGLAAGAAAGPHGAALGAAAGIAAGTVAGLRGVEAAEASQGAVESLLGMRPRDLSTPAARGAAGVLSAGVAAGAAAAAAAGPHGAALGAVAGMAAGLARLQAGRMGAPIAAAVGATLAAAGGGGLRRGRWWWDMASYRLVLRACRRTADWRTAHAVLGSIRSIPPTAFSQPPRAAAPPADGPQPLFADYAVLRSLGRAPKSPPSHRARRRRASAASGGGGGSSSGGQGGAGADAGTGTAGLLRARLLPAAPAAGMAHAADADCFAQAMTAGLADGSPEALLATAALLQTAERAGVADGAVYGVAAQANVRLGRRLEAWQLLQRARARGVELITLEMNVLLGAGARCGQLLPAVALLHEMRRSGSRVAPDVGSYDALLFPLASAGRFGELLSLFDAMQKDGLAPIEPHYRLAISACAARGEGARAAAILLRMQSRGMRYGQAAAAAMLACNREKRYTTTLDIFEALRAAASDAPPSVAFAGGGDDGDGAKRDAWKEEPFRSAYVFNAALDAMRRLHRPTDAAELLQAMRRVHGVAPDHASFGIALASAREAGDARLFLELLRTLCAEAGGRRGEGGRRGFLVSDRLHSELVAGLGFFGEPRRALRLLSQLLDTDLPLSSAVFNRALKVAGPPPPPRSPIAPPSPCAPPVPPPRSSPVGCVSDPGLVRPGGRPVGGAPSPRPPPCRHWQRAQRVGRRRRQRALCLGARGGAAGRARLLDRPAAHCGARLLAS